MRVVAGCQNPLVLMRSMVDDGWTYSDVLTYFTSLGYELIEIRQAWAHVTWATRNCVG